MTIRDFVGDDGTVMAKKIVAAIIDVQTKAGDSVRRSFSADAIG